MWHLGPFPIRAYALCIIAGIVVAVWLGDRRWQARGGKPGQVGDIAIWAVPFGIVGGRLYHVITDNGNYFGGGNDPVTALYIWQGGLGIWGAIALGGVGAYIGARRAGVKFLPLADALAPGIAIAQAIGRLGQLVQPGAVRQAHRPAVGAGDPRRRPSGPRATSSSTTFHPTFLYECLWDLGVAGLVIWADRRFRLGHGRAFALYVAAYCAGRGWIEYLRIDPVEADDVFGLRLNVWTSIVLFVASRGVLRLVLEAASRPRGERAPGRRTTVEA